MSDEMRHVPPETCEWSVPEKRRKPCLKPPAQQFYAGANYWWMCEKHVKEHLLGFEQIVDCPNCGLYIGVW